LWFALSLLVRQESFTYNAVSRRWLLFILSLLVVQLIYGGFMAGMRAAITAPTWPSINGSMLPPGMHEMVPFYKNLAANPITIHFIHRSLAYVLTILVLWWWFKTRNITKSDLFARLRVFLIVIVMMQVMLGILTVLQATQPGRLILLGVSHQFTAMVFLMVLVTLLFIVRKPINGHAPVN
jgi:cytochrome c oxidase assembly protein subunit 15